MSLNAFVRPDRRILFRRIFPKLSRVQPRGSLKKPMRNGDARSAIRLLRTGIVPGLAIDSLSVGYTRFRSEVTSKLDEFTKGKNQKPLFVHGEWGAGKSHCLS